ncbi:hypothetical protein ElyMa_001542000 [Elysia marginata]|uniref:Uncharacterized protein n=1 Tax=Elysia marginata TaxID=1093978 RepID=A0AAV4JAB4_9GAST|nr:hypothetical protein ElyMa_001542000 [Elysia marginata]
MSRKLQVWSLIDVADFSMSRKLQVWSSELSSCHSGRHDDKDQDDDQVADAKYEALVNHGGYRGSHGNDDVEQESKYERMVEDKEKKKDPNHFAFQSKELSISAKWTSVVRGQSWQLTKSTLENAFIPHTGFLVPS